MATLLLQVAGTAIGTMLGGPIGAAIGSAIGGMAGGVLDQSVFVGTRRVEGPRLKSLDGISASEGAPIPRVYGRVRLGGQIIWATKFEEQVSVIRQGKAGGKSAGPKVKTTNYTYFANLAVALCDGPIGMVRRVWADGKPLDLSGLTMRVYRGDELQQPDPLILARQGSAPAYRGTAYVVFERLPLADFGNRLPQLSFEVVRPVEGLAQMIRGVDLIPGATEFGYATTATSRSLGLGSTASENRNQLTHTCDFDASMDALEALCPNANSIAFVASWFGDDLRAGVCTFRPGVDSATKTTTPMEWSVAGLDRATARLVTQIDGRAAYGGTPSDASVIGALADLSARGKSVVYYPFIMMDVAPVNTLPDPWGGPEQSAFPWRGRITCHPAPGQAGSPDGTAAAAAQVAAFFGSVDAGHFTVSGSDVIYSGPDEWSYSRFLLHNAALAKAAGGVDAFIIGSEFIGLTRIRSAATSYAATAHFIALAAQVRAILGPSVKLGYAADWTEYGAHARNNGADVGFPLDPLWADANIDFVGIDYYPPVADWRDGSNHLDAEERFAGRDVAYLKDRLGSGEAFDWYYASDAARAAQNRTPITDGAFEKPWTFRAKDLAGWWSNTHRPRIAGVEQAATPWTPQSKPIWLTEVGCPAVDKGANSPNLFVDPKSSESGYPPFSSKTRDDLIQARFLEAVMRRFDPALPGFVAAHNPVSTVYGGRMVDPTRIHVWAWDARPYPAFPHLSSVWGDADNWVTGHWINGRIEGMPLDRLIAQICADYGLVAPAMRGVDGFLEGYTIDRPMSARAALEPLAHLFGVDIGISAGAVTFAGRGRSAIVSLSRDDIVPDRKGREIARVRAQETELPRQISIGFADAESQYKRATSNSRRLDTASRVETAMETTAVLTRAEGQRIAEQMLQEAWVGRETAELTLRNGLLALECGDIVEVPAAEGAERLLITQITDGASRACTLSRIETSIYDAKPARAALAKWTPPAVPGPATAMVLHLPVDPGDPTPLALLALRAEPWIGPYTLWWSEDGASFEPVATIDQPSVIGETMAPLSPGPLWLWDRANTLTIRLAGAALASLDDATALANGNLLAIGGADGLWEILAYRTAALVSPGLWCLTGLIRGQYGSESAAGRIAPAGSKVALVTSSLVPLFEGIAGLGQSARFRVSPAGADHADASAIAFDAAASPLPLVPISPVRLRARRGAAGVLLDWIRRTRRNGDGWEVLEVPLGEDSESYLVEILDGATVKRSQIVSSPSYAYASADELADFGAAQTVISARIRQISATVGQGAPLVAQVPILPG